MRIWLVGCGNMGGALLRGWLAAGRAPEDVTVIDPVAAPAGGVTHVVRAELAEGRPDTLVLAIKPQQLAAAADGLRRRIGPDTQLISVLAAPPVAILRRCFPDAGPIVRAVPNLPGAIGLGVTALFAENAAADRALAEALFAPLGSTLWLATEALCDVTTATSGCGPAYVFRLAAAMVRGAEGLGLPAPAAQAMARRTLLGAASLLAADPAAPDELAARVASPGGATLAALKLLDGPDGLDFLMARAMRAAAERSREMGEEVASKME